VIGPIYVLNLDRQPKRLTDIAHELDRITDAFGKPLSNRMVRVSAYDAQDETLNLEEISEVDPVYTLNDQLFVEPQPKVAPEKFDLENPIKLTRAEIAVARSHIRIWKEIAQSDAAYSLVLEDDVWFERRFGKLLEHGWREIAHSNLNSEKFDILYLSYQEVRHGAPKEIVSKNVFRPERGLWYLSGYVLSKKGAQALLDLLPCIGPIDLWINHKFQELEVMALRRSTVKQRRDLPSTNSYSILPVLSRIGVLDGGDAALFQRRPDFSPVFAIGSAESGLSSLAMALSMLGYRCCSDLNDMPKSEMSRLEIGINNRVFDAYVNIGSLENQISLLTKNYPNAKYIVVGKEKKFGQDSEIAWNLKGLDVLRIDKGQLQNWRQLCEYLRLAPPDAAYPIVEDVGKRQYQSDLRSLSSLTTPKWLKHDPSPWAITPHTGWSGIEIDAWHKRISRKPWELIFTDDFEGELDTHWLLRNDTFPGNLGIFRPYNISTTKNSGINLTVDKEALGVRDFGAAAISSHESFLYGRFEATLQATNISGLVTGFFLHRNSPRQEIDIEIRGNKPTEILTNVFYNPGSEGSKFDYGYRGTPAVIKLGFDASKALHRFAIEWDPCEIRWFVDDKLIHRRTMWSPTPIPHLPMTLHVNTWPTRSRELAGRFKPISLPATSILRRISVYSYAVGNNADTTLVT